MYRHQNVKSAIHSLIPLIISQFVFKRFWFASRGNQQCLLFWLYFNQFLWYWPCDLQIPLSSVVSGWCQWSRQRMSLNLSELSTRLPQWLNATSCSEDKQESMFSFNFAWADPLIIHAFLSTTSLLSTEQRGLQSSIKILKISQTSMGKDRPCGNPREECHTSVRRCVERWRENRTTQRRQASLCRPESREGFSSCACVYLNTCVTGDSVGLSCAAMGTFYGFRSDIF